MLSHRAILNYVPTFITAVGFRPGDVVVNWLPLYHDYGLFAGFIMPLLSGLPTVLISPFKWVRNPFTLLKAIDDYRGTCCWMPNFGMNHSVRHIPERRLDDLDLSSLRVFASGGEPVRWESQQMFLEKFARCGFSEDALMTGYGMAENTLQLSVTRPGKRAPVDWVDIRSLQKEKRALPAEPNAPGAASIVSCGVLCDNVEGRIVDEDGNDLPERGVGELWIRTGTLFSGYRHRPDLTEQVMTDGWYHTGDVAYMADENVYVCGRKKDLIIVGGRNVYPEDLETVTEGIAGLLAGKAVAFGVPDEELGSEKVILACEVKGELTDEAADAAVREIRRRVKVQMDVVLGDVLLVPKGWVVFTRNRKKSRSGSREKYLAEERA
jgi:fatty-acyl-CoA synthase